MIQFLLDKGAAIEISGTYHQSLLDMVLNQAIFKNRKVFENFRYFNDAKEVENEEKIGALTSYVKYYFQQVQEKALPRNLFLDFQIIQELLQYTSYSAKPIMEEESIYRWSIRKMSECMLAVLQSKRKNRPKKSQ